MALMLNARNFTASLALSALCGCANVAKTPVGPSISQGILGQLTPRDLKPGDCGLFIWSAGPARRLVLFSQNSANEAVWHDGKLEHKLSIKTRSGSEAFAQYPRQEFETQSGETMRLSLGAAQSIESGMRYKSGLLSYDDSENWGVVTPVVGLSSCAPSPLD